MRYSIFSLLFLFLISCSEPTTTAADTPPIAPPETTALPKNTEHIDKKIKKQKRCVISGEVLEDNELWLKDQAKLICILADSSTYDPAYGMSHRILEIFNTYTCKLDLKLTLPVNESPDFPYFLADINYNNNSKVVAIKGAKSVYCLDLATSKMLPILLPKFKTKREEADPSSGQIIRLELWEDFIIGYAMDKGTFVFDLKNPNHPKPILPFAEYRLGENRFNSLFLLPSGKGKYQAILPNYDWEEEIFAINPIFKEPILLETDIQKSALNNKFLVLRQTNKKNSFLINMSFNTKMKLPKELVEQSTKEILRWAKEQR